MAAADGYLTLRRERTTAYVMRGFSVVIDDKAVDKIKAQETKRYAVPAGRHVLRITIDFYKSRPLTFDLRAGETIELVCGDQAPKTIGESLTLTGLGKSLKALTDPGDYLYVRETGRQVARAVSDRQHAPARRPGGRRRAIFLSYRREDSRAFTGRICDRLISHFGKTSIFRDVDSIPVGTDFRDKIRDTIDKSDLLLTVIGPHWLEITNAEGQRRLDLVDDYVRLEIEAALAKGIPVVPVLVDDATMPRADQLPAPIAELAYRNALFIPREPFFHAGVDKLIEEIEGGGEHSDRAGPRFCTGCGKPLGATQKFCTGCGRPAPAAD